MIWPIMDLNKNVKNGDKQPKRVIKYSNHIRDINQNTAKSISKVFPEFVW